MYSISQNLTLEYNTKPFPRLCWLSEKTGSTNLIQMNPSLEKKNTQNFIIENQIDSNSFSIINQSENSVNNNKKEILDLSDNFKINSIVMSAWGPGKITYVNKDLHKVKLRIEDEEQEFDFSALNPFIQIYICIVNENNIKWTLLKFNLSDTCYIIRNKIGNLLNIHSSRVLLIHRGYKIKDYNKTIFSLGLFEKDELLCVIREPIEYFKYRFKSFIKSNSNSGLNSISLKTNKNIIVTGVAFYKNDTFDINYELIIKDNEGVIIYEDDNIFVTKKEVIVDNYKKETFMVKYKLKNEIIFEGYKCYEIQQNIINNNIKEQYIGNQLSENLADENGVIISFIETKMNKINIKDNSTKVDQGLIPGIYYSFK